MYFALTKVYGLKGSKEERLDEALSRSNDSKNSRGRSVKLQEGFPTCQEVITAEDFPTGITEIPDYAFSGEI